MPSTKKSVLEQEWFLLGRPWTHSDGANTAVLAGSNDPHAARLIADFDGLQINEDSITTEEAREIAQHVVELHNASLTQQAQLERDLATETAISDVESFTSRDMDLWHDLQSVSKEDADWVARAVKYLDLRALLERHPTQSHLVRVLMAKQAGGK